MSLFTSIGKVLNIRFLLILLSMIFYTDLYFILKFKVSFIEHYREYFNLNEILLIIISYLVILNIVIPLFAFLLGILGVIFRLILNLSRITFMDKFFDFMSNDDLENLSLIEKKAIENNNSALMKSYEINLEKYKELHSIYLFSFFVLVELSKLYFYDCFSSKLIIKGIELLTFENGSEIFNVIFLWIPGILLLFFSYKYVSSFKGNKVFDWIEGIKRH